MTNKDLEKVLYDYFKQNGYAVRQIAIEYFDTEDRRQINFAGKLNFRVTKK